jgi:hypothetical protein
MNRRKKLIAGGAALVALVGLAGIAFALWSSTGSGSGRATATEAVAAVINPADGTPDLYPGFTEGDVYFTVDNDNSYPIEFTDMTSGAVTSSDEANCPASNVTVEDASGLSLAAPPGTSTELSIDDVVTMDLAAPDGCQGVSFDVELELTGVQSG